MMSKSKMFEYFRARKNGGFNYFYIKVKIQGQKTHETILNDFEALEAKLDYMDGAYDEELGHVSGKINIVEYGVYNSALGVYSSELLEART